MTEATPTIQALLDGAMQQFARHGFAKTSMSDIARASGVSRTSLYNHFQTKEEVFKALSERINDQVYRDVVAAWRSAKPWPERLLDIVNARVGWVYALLHSCEFGRELINEKNRICGGQVLAANDRFAALVRDLLAEAPGAGADAAALAEVLIQSVNGILEQADAQADAETRVGLMVRVFCQGLMKA